MTHSEKLKEYEILSEDRRRAIEIFVKGIVIGAACFAVVLKILLDRQELVQAIFFWSAGFLVILAYHFLCWRVRRFDYRLHRNLNDLTSELGLHPVIPTRAVINLVWTGGSVFTGIWIVLLVYLILTLSKGP